MDSWIYGLTNSYLTIYPSVYGESGRTWDGEHFEIFKVTNSELIVEISPYYYKLTVEWISGSNQNYITPSIDVCFFESFGFGTTIL